MDIKQYLKYDTLFLTSYPEGYSFTWRLLTLKEYRTINALRAVGSLGPDLAALKAFELAYLGDYYALSPKIPAGYINNIGHLILYMSGDGERDLLTNTIELTRASYEKDSILEYMKQTIFTAFPSYLPEHLDNWNRIELINNFIVSEELLIKRGLRDNRLDVSKIKFDNEETQPSSEQNYRIDSIDFEREGKIVAETLGLHIIEEAENRYVEENNRKKNQTVTPEIAKKLDSRRR